MKRTLAILLILVLLLPMCLVTQVDAVETEPFYAVNFGGVAREITLDHIYGMMFTWINKDTITSDTEEVNLFFGDISDVKEAAQLVKEDFDKRPKGTRYITLGTAQSIFYATVVDAVDMEKGVALAKDWATRFFTEYKRIDGKLDGIVLDLEYFHASSYYLNATHYQNGNGNKDIYNQIVANKVYQTRIRPELVKYGFKFYNNPNPSQYPDRSEIWTVYTVDSQGGNGESRAIWDCVINNLLAEYLDESFTQPLLQRYPDAIISDYQVGDSYGWLKPMAHYGSTIQGNSKKAGNTSNYNAYDYVPGPLFYGYPSYTDRTNRTNYIKPASYYEAVYPDSAYGNALWDINIHKRLLMSTDTGLVNSHITFFNYGNNMNGYSNTPYYSELIFHLGLLTTGTFLGYIMENEVLDKAADSDNPNASKFDYNLQVLDDLMKELTRVAGFSDRKPIALPLTWNGGYILSGAYAGGRNIWRITPDTTKVSAKDFMQKGETPTFSVGGLTITFPQGKVIETGAIRETGNCGYWVETPANVMPVVTGSADRYSKSPSFLENFDGYQVGRFTSASVKPDTFWNVTGSVGIVNSGSGKVLGMNGNATVTNTKVPEQITAGDSYAKEQVWEVSVTLPSGNYGDVQLLSFGNGDGGIKISGGKVYYAKGSSYQELSGVALSAGTYTVKRELNFQNAKCTYSVYDTAGNKLGSADNVAIVPVSLPVKTISLSTIGTQVAVHLDNYKIYPAGVAADFEVYDAITGFKVEDTSASRTGDTAYRLSWMNASNQYAVAKIYNGSTLVETVEMQPGTDGVVTAIIKATASNPAKLSVKMEDAGTPDQPDYGSGDSTDGITNGTTDGAVGGDNGSVKPGNNNNQADSNENPDAVPSEKQGLGAGAVALIAVAGMLVLTAGLAIAFWFVVKPKLTEKSSPWLLAIVRAMEKVKKKLKKSSK